MEKFGQIEQEAPNESPEDIFERSKTIGTEYVSLVLKLAGVSQESMGIGVVADATSFESLKGSLSKVRDYILTLPIKNPDKENAGGWGMA
ncbi:MAG: hypothetical protein P4L61_00950 [Candidatus Pacebacteria bacterium]|nr:hypothetical protein [Candidatus Paceibacterota bacterium]